MVVIGNLRRSALIPAYSTKTAVAYSRVVSVPISKTVKDREKSQLQTCKAYST